MVSREIHEMAKMLQEMGLPRKRALEVIEIDEWVRGMLASQESYEKYLEYLAHKYDSLNIRNKSMLEECGLVSREDCMRLTKDDLKMSRGFVLIPGWEELSRTHPGKLKNKLPLSVVNEVRAWFGAQPFVPKKSKAMAAAELKRELKRAKNLLEHNGYKVEPHDHAVAPKGNDT